MSVQDNERQHSTVLVALDGSLAAATALPIAVALAAQLGADCQALHIVAGVGPAADLSQMLTRKVEALTGISPWPDLITPTIRLWQAFAAPTNAIMKAFWHMDVRIDVGDPAAGILRASADPEVTLVVLTTHGHIIESGRSLGRVAEQVIAEVTQPVLLIRPEAMWSRVTHGTALTRLLLPLDGTPTTATLLHPACELASRLGAAVDLLYVAASSQTVPDEPGSIGAPQYVDQPQHEWPEWAHEVIARLGSACAGCPPDVAIRMFLAQGDIGSEIARCATEQGSNVVVLARRSHLEPDRARVLRAVLDQTPCPVLLIGAPTTGPAQPITV